MKPDVIADKEIAAMYKQLRKQPNILLLTTDQQRYDTINAAGYRYMHTPNLDRLVKEGCLYTNAYSPNPACIPARHNIITGLSARYHGMDDNYFDCKKAIPFQLPTFAQILSETGYETIAVGKMHFQPTRCHNGFGKMELMEEIPRHREDDEYAMYLENSGWGHIQSIHGVRHLLGFLPQKPLVPEVHQGTTWVADRIIHHLKTNGGERPFCIWGSWIAPHPPFAVHERFVDLYRNTELPDPTPEKKQLPAQGVENILVADYPNREYARRAQMNYYAAISQVDENIGRILSVLEKMGEIDNTLIIFTSDHGEMLGDFGTYQKFLPYDSSAKIPFIIRYPSHIKQGSVSEDFIDLNDILPTILDAAGVKYPLDVKLPGASLLKDSEMRDRKYQYVEYGKESKRWISFHDRHFKYVYYYGGGVEELYDMEQDPRETNNLLKIDPEGYGKIKADLRKKLLEYEGKWGLQNHIDQGDFVLFEPYSPKPHRALGLPVFPQNIMDDTERLSMNSIQDEILEAVEDEPVVRLEELDLKSWQRLGKFSDEVVNDLVRRHQEKFLPEKP